MQIGDFQQLWELFYENFHSLINLAFEDLLQKWKIRLQLRFPQRLWAKEI